METTELRPLSIGELLDRTFSLYRKRFWLFVGIMAVPAAVSVPFSLVLFYGQSAFQPGAAPTPGAVASLIARALIFVVVFYIAYAVGLGAATFAISDNYLGQQPTVRGSFARVRARMGAVVGLLFNVFVRVIGIALVGLLGIGVAVGAIAFLVTLTAPSLRSSPGLAVVLGAVMIAVGVALYIALLALFMMWILRYSVAIPALLLENCNVLGAIRRSIHLTQGRRWRILVAVFLTQLIAIAGVIVFQGPGMVIKMMSGTQVAQPLWLSFVLAVLAAIGSAITSPLMMIVLVLVYYDLRIRKEAFDLRFMLSSLDPPVPAPNPAAPLA